MNLEPLRFPTPDGEGDGVVVFADRPAPLVILTMDAFGVRPTLTAIAERFAALGYVVAVPNLYWRAGPFEPFEPRTTFGDPSERARVQGLMGAVTPAVVAADTDALIAALHADPRVVAGPVGLLGYCMGGRQAFYLASHLGDRAAAMASIHGGGLVRADSASPHLRANRIRARCYFAVADKDASCTAADCVTLGGALTAAGVRHEIELYPGALHGFAMDDMSVYDAPSSERHWARVGSLFAEAFQTEGF